MLCKESDFPFFSPSFSPHPLLTHRLHPLSDPAVSERALVASTCAALISSVSLRRF
jgi:hypothetical protein